MPEMKDHEEEYARVGGPYQSTPHADLIAEIMDSRIPKNEREHAACQEIEHLRAECLRLSHGLAESMALVMNHEGAIERLRAELATTKSSEFEGWRYADELEQERKRLAADLADLQSHFDSTALHDGIVIDALRADLAEGKRLVKAQKINPSIGPSDSWIKLLAWAYGSAIGDKTSPDEHRAPAAAEKPA